MKKSKLLVLAATGVLLVSCGEGKEIQMEEAKEVAADIAEKVESKDFKAPSKLTAEIKIAQIDGSERQEMTAKVVIDEEAEYYYVYEDIKAEEENTKVEIWSYKEGTKYILAASYDGEKFYMESPILLTSSIDYSISTFVETTSRYASELSKMTKEEYDENCDSYSFKTTGEGNLTVDAKGKEGQTGKIVIDNYLLTYFEVKEESSEQKMTFDWGTAKTSKPNLADFSKKETE